MIWVKCVIYNKILLLFLIDAPFTLIILNMHHCHWLYFYYTWLKNS